MTKYTVISCSGDGDHTIVVLTEEELLNRLNNGNYYEPITVEGGDDIGLDLNCVSGDFIFKGEPIMPVAKEITTKWELK